MLKISNAETFSYDDRLYRNQSVLGSERPNQHCSSLYNMIYILLKTNIMYNQNESNIQTQYKKTIHVLERENYSNEKPNTSNIKNVGDLQSTKLQSNCKNTTAVWSGLDLNCVQPYKQVNPQTHIRKI